jgi:hypothetical protein
MLRPVAEIASLHFGRPQCHEPLRVAVVPCSSAIRALLAFSIDSERPKCKQIFIELSLSVDELGRPRNELLRVLRLDTFAEQRACVQRGQNHINQ